MKNVDCSSFLDSYKSELISQINNIDNRIIEDIIILLEKTELNKGKIYIIGNGGSAATASHMANDFGIGLKRRGSGNFSVESLADNSAVCTAIANDIGYENIFYTQLQDKLNKNDILIAISCSGNSPNIIKAVNYAKQNNINIIGITGFDGGELKMLSSINFHVETNPNEYGIVEDIHMILNHMIYTYFIENK